MDTVLNLLLLRFAVIALLVAAFAVLLFAVALHLKRRGKWDRASKQFGPMASRAVELYAERTPRGAQSSWKGRATSAAARRLRDEDRAG